MSVLFFFFFTIFTCGKSSSKKKKNLLKSNFRIVSIEGHTIYGGGRLLHFFHVYSNPQLEELKKLIIITFFQLFLIFEAPEKLYFAPL